MKVNDPDTFYSLPEHKQILLFTWCNNLNTIEAFNAGHSSYSLKHIFERQAFYITNGEFKGAMLKAGFKVRDIEERNWIFNVSEKSVKKEEVQSW